MSGGLRHLFPHRFRRRRKRDTASLAASLAPLEEQRPAAVIIDQKQSVGGVSQEVGAIVVDRNNLHLPKEMMEGSGTKGLFGIEPVVLVILGLMLAFIAFIAWQISQMPAE